MEYETRKYIENSICNIPCSFCPLRKKFGYCTSFDGVGDTELLEIGLEALLFYKEHYSNSERAKKLRKIYSIKVM